MTLKTIGWFSYPLPINPHYGTGALLGTVILLDAAGEIAALVLPAPKTGNINKVHWRTGTVTTGATMDVRIETVSATTGYPTGTLWSANTNASQVVAAADDNTDFTTTLTSVAAVTKGTDIISVNIVNPAGSPGNLNIITSNMLWYGPSCGGGPEYGAAYLAAAWSKPSAPAIALEYDDGTIVSGLGGGAITGVPNVAVGTGNQGGSFFTLPFTCEIIGMYVTPTSVANDYYLKLYDSSDLTNPIASSALLDKDQQYATSVPGQVYALFATPITKAVGSQLYAVLEASGGTNTISAASYKSSTLLESATKGQSTIKATRTGTSGTFTTDATIWVGVGILIDKIDDGFGSGRPQMHLGVN